MGYSILTLPGFAEIDIIKDYNFNYETLTDVLVIILLSIALFIVIAAPVFFALCWAHYSLEYVKEFRSQFSLKKWFLNRADFELEQVPDLVWIKYRSTYSKMIGFGFAILAYAVSSITYMIQNFGRLEHALKEYFSFPFQVVKNLGQATTPGEVIMKMEEVWMEMLYIVLTSIIFFFVGYIVGAFLVDFRLRRLKKGSKNVSKKVSEKESVVRL